MSDNNVMVILFALHTIEAKLGGDREGGDEGGGGEGIRQREKIDYIGGTLLGNATFVTIIIIIISDWAYMDTAHRRTAIQPSKPKRWCRVDRKDYKKTGRV